ncbi:hypothetical protein RND71_039036 [Anisodus tanguticus]|uniref:DUF4283 domain-containing protein n=2 Tax=Anisodus tanguticus TaxID=243964 RepID=A0AAE1R0R7_9SOLA|nr:hypothetical protein RND71_039036 [Anisodus tanguticus]
MSTPIPIKPVVYLHGEPTIRFERKEVEVMIHHQELNLAIVGKFSHGWPDIAFLRNAIPKQCGLKAEVRIGLLCDRHVLIRCTILEDFDTLMSRQTFEIKEKNKPYLMRTFKWDVSFNPAEESRFAYGWISFPGLSPHYYGETTLFSMAAAVGTPIAIDAATLNKTRPSCARVKVEFDLLRSHPQHVVIQVGEGDEITSDLQKIRYDFKPKYCINCKLQGHDVNGCWNLKPELRPENSKAIDGGKEAAAMTIGKEEGDFRRDIKSCETQLPAILATATTGRPPPEVVQHPATIYTPPTYANIVTHTIPTPQNPTVGGGNGLAETSLGRNPTPPIPQKPITYLHGEPTIRFTNQEVASMVEQQDLKYAVVGKFSHGMPSIAFLRTAIPKQCSLKAEVNIGLLHNRHVLIRCSIEEDYVTLMSRPNFWIKENSKSFFMRTFKWDIWFTPEEETSMAVIWLSFPNLPPNFYVPSILFSIASAVGRPIAIDAATLNKTRPSCARVKVEADLLQEHPQKYNIQIMNGEEMETISYKIRYDFLPKYCTTCMLLGHDHQGCWKEHPELQPEKRHHGDDTVVAAAKGKVPNPTPPPTNPSRQNPNPKPLPTAPNHSQEWTTVSHKRKKQNTQKQHLVLTKTPFRRPKQTIPSGFGRRKYSRILCDQNPAILAVTATGWPPSEVTQLPATTPLPVTYSQIVTNTHKACGGNGVAETSLGRNPTSPIPQKPITYLHGEPTIRFTNQEMASMVEQQDLKYAVVGKFSHGMPSIAFLRTAIPKQCFLKAEVNIGLLHNRHVLIRCSIEEDYVNLMSRPNFWIKENSKSFLMRTFKWDIWFTPEEETSMAVIWLSFPNLPPNFYVPSILFSIASAVGKPIAIDAATLNKTRPSCARVKVEADLLKEHPQKYNIQIMNGEEMETSSYKIRYDFLPKYCTTCMLQGHDLQGCWKEHPELQPERRLEGDGTVAAAAKGKIANPTPPPTNPSRQNPNPKPLPTATNPTQEWTTVTHKRKNQNQQKQPLESLENKIPMPETVNPASLNAGNNPPRQNSHFSPKSSLKLVS